MEPNETPTNIELQDNVTAALQNADAVDSTLGVSAHEGVVTLSGSVTDATERSAARAVTSQVPGVTAISDEIAAQYRGSPPSAGVTAVR
jgi:osmotically-inducible protein OsmY